MSMTTSPFGTPVTEAPPTPATPVSAAPEPSKRNLVILAVVAGALVVGAGVYFLLFSGGADLEVAAGPVTPGVPRVVATAPPTAPVAPPIKKYVAAKARNPFIPLVAAPAAVPAAAAASGSISGTPSGTVSGTGSGRPAGSVSGVTGGAPSGAGSAVPSTGTGVGAPGFGGTPSGVAPGTGVGSSPAPALGGFGGSVPAPVAPPAPQVKVTMAAVSSANTSAKITIDSKSFTVAPLEEFGSFFKLLNLRDGSCGAIQFGDVVFDLCEGGSRTVS